MTTSVLVAGATGGLGQRIVQELLTHDTRIRVLTPPGSGTADALYAGNDRVDIVTATSILNGAFADMLTGTAPMMFSGQAQVHHVANDRFGVHDWTTVRDVLEAHLASADFKTKATAAK
jgi:NAD(P)-dependent dehydrogenase (short-subunit alcohol dehydrogenase family)